MKYVDDLIICLLFLLTKEHSTSPYTDNKYCEILCNDINENGLPSIIENAGMFSPRTCRVVRRSKFLTVYDVLNTMGVPTYQVLSTLHQIHKRVG